MTMRKLLALVLALGIVLPARAATYVLVDGSNTCQNTIVWDGVTPYTPPAGLTAVPQASATCTPPAAPANPTTITALAFFNRFTQAETQAIWKAAAADTTGAIGAGLTNGLAAGTITLTDPIVQAWMNALVTAGAITSARETAILTP